MSACDGQTDRRTDDASTALCGSYYVSQKRLYSRTKRARWRGVEFPSCRLVLTLLAFFGFLNIYCLRVNLSVALVAMVNISSVQQTIELPNATDGCGNLISQKEKTTDTVSVPTWLQYSTCIYLRRSTSRARRIE